MTGFININKREGVSSAREVAVIKKLSGKPCGHMGTLDPMASGVLPIGIGNACRLFDYMLEKRKKYSAVFRFGEDSDTLDTTGEITVKGARVPGFEEITAVLPNFIGEIMQVPPKYSAKNIGGRRGYQLAREGKEFTLPPKKVKVYALDCERIDGNSFKFYIECGGGTYVRSLARDIAAALGTCAIMSSLVRTQSGGFCIENSVKSELLTPKNIESYIIPTQAVLPYEDYYPTAGEAKKLFNGLSVETEKADGFYKIYSADGFYGIAEANNSIIKIRTKLC